MRELSYYNRPADGHIEFSDGKKFRMPPVDEEEKAEILSRIAEAKKPECKKCGSTMAPHIRKKGAIMFYCGRCNRKSYIQKECRGISDAEILERIASYREGIAILNEIVLERGEM